MKTTTTPPTPGRSQLFMRQMIRKLGFFCKLGGTEIWPKWYRNYWTCLAHFWVVLAVFGLILMGKLVEVVGNDPKAQDTTLGLPMTISKLCSNLKCWI